MAVIPNTNVNLATNIRDVLNADGGNATNEVRTFFNNVKRPWSKKKPVPRSEDFCQDFDSSKPNYLANWWKGSNGLCGFVQSSIVYTSAASLITAYTNKTTWQYQTPTSPFRVGDFCGYSTDAISPCNMVSVDGELVYGDSNSSVRVSTVIYKLDYTTNLSISDLKLGTKDFKDCYYGVILVQGGTAHPYYYKTLSSTIGTVNSNTIRLSLDFTYSELSTILGTSYGEYNIYPAIFTNYHTSFTSTLVSGTSLIAVPPPHSGTFQHTFTLARPVEEKEVLFSDAWWQGGDRLIMGGTIKYKYNKWQNQTVAVTFYKNGVNIENISRNVTLENTEAADSSGFRYQYFDYKFIGGAAQNDYTNRYTMTLTAGTTVREATAYEK